MIQSMTGYGKAEINLENTNFTIEVKSLNSKHIDTNIKMSSIYRDKEIGIRSLISKKLQRGKVELSIWREKFIFNWEIISKEKHFNDNFKRMWEYYLSYCEAGFLSGSTDVHQILLNKQ